jgi:glutathione S-transferase
MLKLFVRRGCQYCEKVLVANHADIGADLELCYVEREEHLKSLLEQGGKKQVPFLVDEERDIAMYESDDILEYLAEYYGS